VAGKFYGSMEAIIVWGKGELRTTIPEDKIINVGPGAMWSRKFIESLVTLI
jgi:hypothetical protein